MSEATRSRESRRKLRVLTCIWCSFLFFFCFFFFFQAEDGIRDPLVTGVQTCALPISQIIPALRDLGHEVFAVDTATGRLAAADERRLLSAGVAPDPPSDSEISAVRDRKSVV